MTTAGAVVAAAGLLVASVGASAGTAIYVNPAVSTSGDGTQTKPFKKIQDALNKAQPGDTVNLMPGVYREQPKTVRNGSASAPITIKGTETGKNKATRYNTVLFGTGRIFNIDHSYITIQGFTIDGQEKLRNTTYPTSIGAMNAFKDANQANIVDSKLIYIGSADTSRDITGVTIDDMLLSGAGTECVRMRNNANGNTVMNSVVQYCGMFAKTGTTSDRYHNGEAIYVGTSPKSTTQPMYDNDQSNSNVVTNNVISTFGSECFNVKENAHDNVFESNQCSGNTEGSEYNGSNIELRGHNNIIRGNTVSDSANWNIKIQSDSDEYDKGGNQIIGNTLSGAASDAIHIKSTATQGTICGNKISGSSAGDYSAACPAGTQTSGDSSTPEAPVKTTPADESADDSATEETSSDDETSTDESADATDEESSHTTTDESADETSDESNDTADSDEDTTNTPSKTPTKPSNDAEEESTNNTPAPTNNTPAPTTSSALTTRTFTVPVPSQGTFVVSGTVATTVASNSYAYVSVRGPGGRSLWRVENISTTPQPFAIGPITGTGGQLQVTVAVPQGVAISNVQLTAAT